MSVKRKQHPPAFKAKVALEAIKGQRSINELATFHKIHPNQINQWRKQLLEHASELFATGHRSADEQHSAEVASLYQQIGQMSVELDWLKKKL